MSSDQNQATKVRLYRQPAGGEADDRVAEPNPRAWVSNNAAGAEYLTRKEPYESLIRFRQKPSQQVIAHLKDQGFGWNREEQVWARHIGYNTAEQDRVIGRRAFDTAVAMILEEKGEGRQAS